MYKAGKTYLEGEKVDGMEAGGSIASFTIDFKNHINKIIINGDDEGELRDKIIAFLNDEKETEEEKDPIKFVINDVNNALKDAIDDDSLSETLLYTSLDTLLEQAYPFSYEEWEEDRELE